MLAAIAQAQESGARLAKVCAVVGLSVRTVERWRLSPGADDGRHGPQHRPGNALTPAEQERVIELMTLPGHLALPPKQLVPKLADEGIYVASESTMYRLQQQFGLRAPSRSAARSHVTRSTTVHNATAPNQVWSWDITYLPTLVRGRFFYLYLVVDVWSRRIVGWKVHERESDHLAAEMIVDICAAMNVDPKGLVLHSDNGKPMRGRTMITTLQWLGIVPSFSRPHVSNDNPYSEALFRTLKHVPAYPSLPFANVADAQRWVTNFVAWYNGKHRHSAIRFVTPDERHFGGEAEILAKRRALYEQARRKKPARWSGASRNWTPLGSVVLNPKPIATQAAT